MQIEQHERENETTHGTHVLVREQIEREQRQWETGIFDRWLYTGKRSMALTISSSIFPFTRSREFQNTSIDSADVLERYPLMSQQAIVSPTHFIRLIARY